MAKDIDMWFNISTEMYYYRDNEQGLEWGVRAEGFIDAVLNFSKALNRKPHNLSSGFLERFFVLHMVYDDFDLLSEYIHDLVYRDRRFKKFPTFDEYRALLTLRIESLTSYDKNSCTFVSVYSRKVNEIKT